MRKTGFKYFVFVILCAIVMPLCCVAFSFSHKDEVVAYDNNIEVTCTDGVLKRVKGDFLNTRILNLDDAYEFLQQYKDTFKFTNARESLGFIKEIEGLTGQIYYFEQYFDSRKVFGGEIKINTNEFGNVESINGKYYRDFAYDNTVNYSQEQVYQDLEQSNKYSEIEFIEEQIYVSNVNAFITYAYCVLENGEQKNIYISARTNVSVLEYSSTNNARSELPTEEEGWTITTQSSTQTNHDGEEVSVNIEKYLNNQNGSFYYILADSSRNIYMTDGRNLSSNNNPNLNVYLVSDYYKTSDSQGVFVNSNDSKNQMGLAITAYQSLITCYDYYANASNLGVSIKGITSEGQPVKLIAIVHYGTNETNAGYSGSGSDSQGYFIFGDGDGSDYKPFALGLDIVAHEYQHAITTSITDLKYFGQSGGLNEAYSDMFGAIIENRDINSAEFWTMGEDIVIDDGYNCRDMRNPKSSYSLSNLNLSKLKCVDNYQEALDFIKKMGSSDNGGVHYTSTLMTYATYLMYKQNPTAFTKQVIARLWFETLRTYLTTDSGFLDFAEGMMLSADDLGYSEEMKRNMALAFASIGIELDDYSFIETWNGNTLTVLQGDGNTASPYLISSVKELATALYYINNNIENYDEARYRLTTSLDLENALWEPIGTMENPFNGSFNGGQNTISGLNLTSVQGKMYSGLFGYVGSNGFIYDLNVSGNDVTSKATYTGSIVGYNCGAISGCSSNINISGDYVGGLTGITISMLDEQKIANSYSTGNLRGQVVGGLTAVFNSRTNEEYGYLVSGYVSSCYATGTLTGNIVGGLIGQANGVYLINNIITSTIVENTANATLGAFVGQLYFNDFINNKDVTKATNFILGCYSTAVFNATNSTLGAVVGEIFGDLSQGKIYLEKNTIKKQVIQDQLVPLSKSDFEQNFITNKNLVLSDDNLYEGAFDFDEQSFINNQNNWIYFADSEAFDLVTTFQTNQNQMPVFREISFWVNSLESNFEGGNGTASSPYEIKTAGQLAYLSYLLSHFASYDEYQLYANKYYKLVADINMQGKVWLGIGHSQIIVDSSGNSQSDPYFFTGHFDGNGYSIRNVESLGVYSVKAISANGDSYILYQYLPALFSSTAIQYDLFNYSLPSIKNLTLEKSVSRGNYAAAVVSKAYYGINMENVSVNDALISSAGIAGGLIARIESVNTLLNISLLQSTIKSCYFLGTITAQVAGAAVGMVSNASAYINSALDIINFIYRGTINVNGVEKESIITSSEFTYYKAIAGSFVGISNIKKLTIINSLAMGNIVAYNSAHIGGFIGITSKDKFTQDCLYVVIDGCKFMGDSYYLFDNHIQSDYSAIGYVYSLGTTPVIISINKKTFTNQSCEALKQDSGNIQVMNEIQVSNSLQGQEGGDFDIYNNQYFNNSNYFNADYYWTEEEIDRIMFKVEFINVINGVEIVLKTITGIKEGQNVSAPTTNPTRPSTVAYHYYFTGWSEDFTNITKSLKVYAVYDEVLRSYKVQYLDRTGKVIETKTIEYGKPIDQTVKAPEKAGTFFYDYEFVRWGAQGQTVAGDTKVVAYYKSSLSSKGMIVIFVATFLILGATVIITTRKKVE